MQPSALDVLLDAGPLSQVVFIHDYLQLVFEDVTLSIYNPLTLRNTDGRVLSRETPGYCDAIVALIGQRVASHIEDNRFTRIRFQAGVELAVSLRSEDVAGHEAFELRGPNDVIVVQQDV